MVFLPDYKLLHSHNRSSDLYDDNDILYYGTNERYFSHLTQGRLYCFSILFVTLTSSKASEKHLL